MTVVNVSELVGSSNQDWVDAVNKAVSEASKTYGNVFGVEVVNFTANIENGHVKEYNANVKIASRFHS